MSRVLFCYRLEGRPKPAPRARSWQGRTVKVPEYEAWSLRVSGLLADAHGEGLADPLAGPLVLWLDFVWRLPKSKPAKWPAGHAWPPIGHTPRTSTPDFDNVAKAICDAMTRAGVIEDDSQIARATVQTLYAPRGVESYSQITLRSWHEADHFTQGVLW